MRGGTIVITGAFSYTGKYATRLLLSRGYDVRTLTYHPDRENEFGLQAQVFPYHFDQPGKLVASLHGASTLINTYWVRYPHGTATFGTAVRNTIALIAAAKKANIQRIVHVSIANPSLESPLAYYRGKAQLEEAVVRSGLSHFILRPTVIFGREDILINNIAWFVRRFPVFGIPGDGRYRVRPIYVEDMARLILTAAEGEESEVVDAVGPETFTFEGLVREIARHCGRTPCLLHLPAPVSYMATQLIGWFVGDTILTCEEYKGLMSDLLAPEGPPAGETRLTQWLADNGENLGHAYASEVARHYSHAG